MKTRIIIKVLLNHETEMCIICCNVMCGFCLFSLNSRNLEEFVKLPPAFNTAAAENPILHRYDVAKVKENYS